ncbi:MAG: carboxypeptidase regulatory-like domain-containing protein [Nocardioidaceae bacterium]
MPVGLTAPGVASLDGQLWVVGGCMTEWCGPGSKAVYSYDPDKDTWTRHSDYPVVAAWLACGAVADDLVCAGGKNPNTGATLSATYVYDPAEDTWTRGADMPYDDWGMASVGANGKLLVQGGVTGGGRVATNQAAAYDPASDTWSALPNGNDAVYRGAGTCGFAVIGGSTADWNPVPFSEVLPGYRCGVGPDVSWLSADVTEFDVAPGETVKTRVVIDSGAVSQPGDYAGGLALSTDSPYRMDPVGVTMHVQPPRSWGKITGMVTDASSGDPVPGATVQVCTMFDRTSGQCGPVTYTLKTDAEGRYRLWLNQGYNPLKVVAARDGYQSKVTITRIQRGQTTTADFALQRSH